MVSLRQLFTALAFSLVPLGLAAWIAFTLSFVFATLSYALPGLSDPLGWGWDLFGTAKLAWRPGLTDWIPWMQASVLVIGLIMSIKTADAILRRFTKGRATMRGLVIQAAALTLEMLFFLWLYLGASA